MDKPLVNGTHESPLEFRVVSVVLDPASGDEIVLRIENVNNPKTHTVGMSRARYLPDRGALNDAIGERAEVEGLEPGAPGVGRSVGIVVGHGCGIVERRVERKPPADRAQRARRRSTPPGSWPNAVRGRTETGPTFSVPRHRP